MPAKSSFEMSDVTARSGLPTSPIKTESPVKTPTYFPVSSLNTIDELSIVCPGVCNQSI